MENIKIEGEKRGKRYFFQQVREYHKFVLLFTILLGLFVRVYKISGLDVGGAWDEGYYMIAVSNLIEHKNLLLIDIMPDKDGLLIDKPPGLYIFGALFIKLFGNYELGARAVSILFGTISIYAFFVLVNYITKERGLALLSAFIFAFFPLHIALSRTFMPYIPALFFSITSIYLLIKGVGEKKLKLLLIAGVLIVINLFMHLWYGFLSVVGIMIWMLLYTHGDKDRRKYFFYAFLCISAGFLIFMIWPLLLYLNEDKYYGFHGGCLLPNCDVWDMIFKQHAADKAGITGIVEGRWTSIINKISSPYSVYADIMQMLSRPYLGQGHFDFAREFDNYFKIFLYFGIFLSLIRLNQNSIRRISLFWFFWIISYLPIHLGKNLYTQYLILLVPFFSFYIAYGIYGLDAIQLKFFQNKLLLAGITILICFLFFLNAMLMIERNREYLYKTNYKMMSEYLRNKTTPSKVICSCYPGMSYYLKGQCMHWDSVSGDLAEYFKKNQIKYVDARRGTQLQAMQRTGCKKINHIVGIPENAEHSLFKCGDL